MESLKFNERKICKKLAIYYIKTIVIILLFAADHFTNKIT